MKKIVHNELISMRAIDAIILTAICFGLCIGGYLILNIIFCGVGMHQIPSCVGSACSVSSKELLCVQGWI